MADTLRFGLKVVFFFLLFSIVVDYGEREKSDTSPRFAELIQQAIIQLPPSYCVRATTVLFSRGKYTHSSIILFLTVFHYCLRKEGSHAQLAPLSTDNFKGKFTGFPTITCQEKLLPYFFAGSTWFKANDVNNSGIQHFDNDAGCFHLSLSHTRQQSWFLSFQTRRVEQLAVLEKKKKLFVMSQRGRTPFPLKVALALPNDCALLFIPIRTIHCFYRTKMKPSLLVGGCKQRANHSVCLVNKWNAQWIHK